MLKDLPRDCAVISDRAADPFHGGGIVDNCGEGDDGGQVDLTFFQKVIYNTEGINFDCTIARGSLFFSAGGWGWSWWQYYSARHGGQGRHDFPPPRWRRNSARIATTAARIAAALTQLDAVGFFFLGVVSTTATRPPPCRAPRSGGKARRVGQGADKLSAWMRRHTAKPDG